MGLWLLFTLCVKESRKAVLNNENTINDTINAFTDNYNSFMRAHKNILITLNNLYYAIHN